MMIIVSLMLFNEGMLQETKIITLPIYNTEFRIYNIIYISGPPSEEKNPPSSGSAYGLVFILGMVYFTPQKILHAFPPTDINETPHRVLLCASYTVCCCTPYPPLFSKAKGHLAMHKKKCTNQEVSFNRIQMQHCLLVYNKLPFLYVPHCV